MQLPGWLHLFVRPFPSANMALLATRRPLLIDAGFGSDAGATLELLRAAGVPPERLSLLINTHYHCDHVGGNYALQSTYGVPIGASAHDAELINRRDPAACAAEWLDQPIEPYRIDRPLADGELIEVGEATVQVIAAPGHTRGQLVYYLPEQQILFAGDTVHGDDIAWINPFLEGVEAIERAMATIERLRALPLRLVLSGHGPPYSEPQAVFAAALERYRRWRAEPQRIVWHACKRIFAYHLMLCGGMRAAEIPPYLCSRAWFVDYCSILGATPQATVEPFLDEMLRSGAAGRVDGQLIALAPFTPPAGWQPFRPRLRDWPPA